METVPMSDTLSGYSSLLMLPFHLHAQVCARSGRLLPAAGWQASGDLPVFRTTAQRLPQSQTHAARRQYVLAHTMRSGAEIAHSSLLPYYRDDHLTC